MFDPKRKAYIVKVRCILNGADTTKRLWLLDTHGVLEVMRRYVPRAEAKSLRLLSIELDPDQSWLTQEHKRFMQTQSARKVMGLEQS